MAVLIKLSRSLAISRNGSLLCRYKTRISCLLFRQQAHRRIQPARQLAGHYQTLGTIAAGRMNTPMVIDTHGDTPLRLVIPVPGTIRDADRQVALEAAPK